MFEREKESLCVRNVLIFNKKGSLKYGETEINESKASPTTYMTMRIFTTRVTAVDVVTREFQI